LSWLDIASPIWKAISSGVIFDNVGNALSLGKVTKRYLIRDRRKVFNGMVFTVSILAVIGVAAALFIAFKVRRSFKSSDCGSCCGSCDKACENRNKSGGGSLPFFGD